MKNSEIYINFEKHLMNDENPSHYFNQFFQDKTISASYPLSMLHDLKNIKQSPKYHPEGNVWNHTMLVIDNAATRKDQSRQPKALMWAALLHDLGKVPATKIRKGRITAYNHDKLGEKMAVDFLTALNAPQEMIHQVSKLVRWHMQILFVVKDLPFADITTMLNDVNLDDIALLSLCDRLGRGDIAEKNIQTEQQNVKLFVKKCKETLNTL